MTGGLRGGRRAQRVAWLLGVGTLFTLGVVVLFYFAGIALGEREVMQYRFSRMIVFRATNWWPLLVLLPALLGAMAGLGRGSRAVRGASLVVAMLALAGMMVLTWWATPRPTLQAWINFTSPAQDGAFVLEAQQVTDPADYLRNFNQRLQRTPAELKGTRILSNTPGTTVFAWWIFDLFPPQVDPPGRIERYLLETHDVTPRYLPATLQPIQMSLAMLVPWALAALCAYGLGRVFFSPLGAFVFAALVVFNPATAHFAPGKDVAQLLTICAMLWAWFYAARARAPAWAAGPAAAAAGALLMVGAAVGLIHFWIAAAAWCTTAAWWISQRLPWRGLLIRSFWALVGSAAACLTVYGAIGWNMPTTFLAVAERFESVQETILFNRSHWLLIGLPLFVVFLSPGLVALALLRRKVFALRRRGSQALACTLAVMGLTYFMGVTYELPRLWIAFIPLLMLGAGIDQPLLRGVPRRRTVQFLMILVAVSVVVTVLHWSWLDVRESEWRLFITRRGFM